jgi:hypothetical protein
MQFTEADKQLLAKVKRKHHAWLKWRRALHLLSHSTLHQAHTNTLDARTQIENACWPVHRSGRASWSSISGR